MYRHGKVLPIPATAAAHQKVAAWHDSLSPYNPILADPDVSLVGA